MPRLLPYHRVLSVALLGCALAGCATGPTDLFNNVTTGSWSWLLVPLVVAVLLVTGTLCRQVSVLLVERTHASRVARLMDTLGSVADGIAHTILAHPPAAAGVLAAVRQAAIAQGVAYAKATLPGTIAAIGVSDDVLAARLSNAVAGAELDAAADRGAQLVALLRAAVAEPDPAASALAAAPVPATA